MSLTGALIEGAVLPDDGTAVTLRRGSLEAGAKIVWKAGRRAGIAFCAAIEVSDWMSRTPPCHQAKVDQILRNLRGTCQKPAATAAPVPPSGESLLETELLGLKAELAQLETGLTSDLTVVAAHPEIQLLDLARQRVERLLASQSPG